ncbi:MAG: hypothetical protein J5792_06065, partial [Bacteroidales bacterium]|nr:hypothetical protein [Bacteroidales bacterium]
MSEKVLFIDEPAPRMELELNALGFSCDHFSRGLFAGGPSGAAEQASDYELLLPVAAQYTGFVIRSRFAIDRKMIDAAASLRFIARIGAGMENIDTA